MNVDRTRYWTRTILDAINHVPTNYKAMPYSIFVSPFQGSQSTDNSQWSKKSLVFGL